MRKSNHRDKESQDLHEQAAGSVSQHSRLDLNNPTAVSWQRMGGREEEEGQESHARGG